MLVFALVSLAVALASPSAAAPSNIANSLLPRGGTGPGAAIRTYLGCYAGAIDGNTVPYPAGSPLPNQALMFTAGLFSVTQCQDACANAGLAYAATQAVNTIQKYCWCGNALPTTQRAADCTSSSGKFIGGVDSFAVYEVLIGAVSNTVPHYVGYTPYLTAEGSGSSSCYGSGTAPTFTVGGGPLWAARSSESAMTVGICTGACSLAGYQYAGLESGQRCFCTNINPANKVVASSQCATPCTGDNNEICGGSGYYTVYEGVAAGITIPSIGFPSYAGCFAGAIDGNVAPLPTNQPLPNQLLLTTAHANVDVTVANCQSACLAANFAFAAIQSSTNGDKYCWCGDALPTLPAGNCAAEAGGTSLIGGVDSYAVYQVAAVNPTKAPANTLYYDSFRGRAGSFCYKDSSKGTFTVGDFPASLERSSEAGMTVGICTGACATAGFKFAGLENGNRCYCTNLMGAAIVDAALCTSPCAGDANMKCGGPGFLSVYWRGNH